MIFTMRSVASVPELLGQVLGQAEQITRRHTDAIAESVAGLSDLGLVQTASTQVRVHRGSAMFKLYILNRAEAFFGFYPIAEHAVTLRGEPVPMYDLMGKDATMFHHERGARRPHASAAGRHGDQRAAMTRTR